MIVAVLIFFAELLFIPVAAWGLFSFKKRLILIPLLALMLSIISFGEISAAFENITL